MQRLLRRWSGKIRTWWHMCWCMTAWIIRKQHPHAIAVWATNDERGGELLASMGGYSAPSEKDVTDFLSDVAFTRRYKRDGRKKC